MIASAAALPAAHHVGSISRAEARHPAPVLKVGESTGECVSSFGDYFGAHFPGNPLLRIAVAKDGPYALVSWEFGASGGMELFRRVGPTWCRIEVRHGWMQAGGSPTPTAWLTPDDIAGFDELDAARASRLFDGRSVAQTLRVRSVPPPAVSDAAHERHPASVRATFTHVR